MTANFLWRWRYRSIRRAWARGRIDYSEARGRVERLARGL